MPARSKACGGLFVRACWVCGPWWRMSGVRVVSVSGSLPRAPNGRAETRVAQKACLAQCEQGETPKVLLGAMPARCTMASHTSKHVVVVVLLSGSRLGVACSCDSFTWLVLDGAAVRLSPEAPHASGCPLNVLRRFPRTLPSGVGSALPYASACRHAPRRAGGCSSGRAGFADRGGG